MVEYVSKIEKLMGEGTVAWIIVEAMQKTKNWVCLCYFFGSLLFRNMLSHKQNAEDLEIIAIGEDGESGLEQKYDDEGHDVDDENAIKHVYKMELSSFGIKIAEADKLTVLCYIFHIFPIRFSDIMVFCLFCKSWRIRIGN